MKNYSKMKKGKRGTYAERVGDFAINLEIFGDALLKHKRRFTQKLNRSFKTILFSLIFCNSVRVLFSFTLGFGHNILILNT